MGQKGGWRTALLPEGRGTKEAASFPAGGLRRPPDPVPCRPFGEIGPACAGNVSPERGRTKCNSLSEVRPSNGTSPSRVGTDQRPVGRAAHSGRARTLRALASPPAVREAGHGRPHRPEPF